MACCGKKEGIRYSIVIPTYNHLQDGLKPCLESLFQYTDMKDKEVVVVANGCTDGTEQYVQGLMMGDRIKLLTYPEPLGYAKACNAGIQACGGDYIVLLNNDTILLEQTMDDWINILAEPFLKAPYEKIGMTGPLRGYSDPADAMFLVFFVTMINKKLIEEIGLLSLEFGVGGGEDTEYCIRAERAGWKVLQVPEWSRPIAEKGFMVGPYPIYHKGELTVHDNPEWGKIFEENSQKLREKFNDRANLHHGERGVIGKDHEIPIREEVRYRYALNEMVGHKVLDIGCTSGFPIRILYHKGIDYTGIDYFDGIIEYANRNYGDYEGAKFLHADINNFPMEQYDTIIAFELFEHVVNGRELAQSLKQYCKKLIFSVPYNEAPGAWAAHKLDSLTEKDFPGYKFKWMTYDGMLLDEPLPNTEWLSMIGIWENNEEEEKRILSGAWDRIVLSNADPVPPREDARYKWAANQIVGNKVLEVGCTSGYGIQYIHHDDIDYLGIDIHDGVIEYARRQYGDKKGVKFLCADANTFPLEYYDTIIMFETLEHMANGVELFNKMKSHCRLLLSTVPYNEVQGWVSSHVLHHLNESHFPGCEYEYLTPDGKIHPSIAQGQEAILLLRWEKPEEKIEDFLKEESNILKGVLCEVLTKDRYHDTLPITLYAIAQQEAVPETIVIFDDSEKRQNLAEMPLYSYLFALLNNAGIKEIKVELGGGRGVPFARNYILNKFGKDYNYIWRVDDDEAPDPDVLRSLYNTIVGNHDIAAVGGSIISPHEYKNLPEGVYNNISTLKTAPNMQWFFNDKKMFHVEHLTSSFIFEIEKAKEVGGYNQNLSKVGHREETILTYSLFKQGWLLAYIPNTVTWHLRYPTGGIRSADYGKEMYDHDEEVFDKFLSGDVKKELYMVLDNGIGDHYMFKEVWPEIKRKHADKKLILATAYRGIIEDADEIISIAEAQKRLGNIDRFNVYGVCAQKGYNLTIQNGYREMYL